MQHHNESMNYLFFLCYILGAQAQSRGVSGWLTVSEANLHFNRRKMTVGKNLTFNVPAIFRASTFAENDEVYAFHCIYTSPMRDRIKKIYIFKKSRKHIV